MSIPDRSRGLLAIGVTAVLWGTTGTAATFAPEVSPLAIGAFALGIGGLLQAAIAIPAIRGARVALRHRRRIVIVGAIAVAIYPLAFYSSMHAAGVAVGSVVSLASAPLASGVLERLIDKRRLGSRWVTAAALGVAGSVLLSASNIDAASPASGGTLLGIGLGVVAGITYATYSWAAHRLMAAGIPRPASMGSIFGGGGLLLLPVLALTGAPIAANLSNAAMAIYMALVPMFLGYVLFGYGLTKVSSSTATTVTLAEPAIATVLAVIVVHERLTTAGWIGMAFIAAALIALATTPSRPRDHNTHRPATRRSRRHRTTARTPDR